MGRNAKLKEKHQWSNEKPKLDNARRLRGVSFIDAEDKEFKQTIKHARKKLETPMATAMLCKMSNQCKHGEILGIHARRLDAREVLMSRRGDIFIFPFADGTAKLFGREHRVRESTLRREQPVRSEDLRAEIQATEGDFIYLHHIEPRVQLCVPKEESLPIPLKHIDRRDQSYMYKSGCVARRTF